jgi:hypothetical protein
LLKPVAEAQHVGSAAGEQLADVADVETGPADDVAHERVAGDELAAGDGLRQRVEIGVVAGLGAPERELVRDRPLHPPAGFARGATGLLGQAASGRELAQQLEQA